LSRKVIIKANESLFTPQKYMEPVELQIHFLSLSIRWCSQLHALASLLPRN